MTTPTVLCILDGWGLRDTLADNAPALATTPHFDRLMQDCPTATLITHGRCVGLPTGQMGNSEVGHMTIGAGRVVAMDLGRIDMAIEDGSFGATPQITQFADRVSAQNGRVHLFSVVSDGGVHGHISHLKAAVDTFVQQGFEVLIHAITDGRDVAPRSAQPFIQDLEDMLPQGATIATVIGRYYAMDRDNRWERVKTAYDAIATGQGTAATSAQEAITAAYAADQSDEFIPATVIGTYAGIREGDGLFCMNFRSDRAREIMQALAAPSFDAFDRDPTPRLSACLGMVSYSQTHDTYMQTAFPKENIHNTLGAWVAQHGKRQFRVAETEKYPHVTFFLNGGKETPEEGEDRVMPPSPKVATYDLAPEMAAAQVAQHAATAIEQDYDLVVVNFANPDMVGHTGDLEAAKRACTAVDTGLGVILEALGRKNGTMLVTADHGNCETMRDPDTGGAHTAHTLNPVPLILVNGPKGAKLSQGGRLADLAPTVLEIMGLDQPTEMTGTSLINQ